ncbi:MAG: methionine--tRNA ligase [Polyangia bacterium]|jgi:methionyl-tRNA synthetase|nr:methionine--tRNA ligase [Polyangia bacterium]
MSEKILITSALPYANGDIHIGHLVEYIQTDIFARFHRLLGNEVLYFCASDTHGTPIEIKASQLGISPEDLVARYNAEHYRDFVDFQIFFDRFYTTHSPETEHHAVAIYEALKAGGLTYTKDVDLAYCEHDGRFLPDRFVKGTCPKCGAEEQYGDNCEVCGATYDPTDLVHPVCSLCGNPPERRVSKHYFFALSSCREQIRAWIDAPGHLHSTTANWLKSAFLEGELRDWDISRDAPYFGFHIPGETDKFFYVWLDAPIGYIGTTQKHCDELGLDFDGYWKRPGTRIVHVIGKDIAYFHCLFWPAMLINSNYRVPDRVQVHGFLTVNGQKMAKRTGTAVSARTYLEHLDPQFLRFYYASKLGPTNADLDLSLEDFVNRVNADLVNKVANLASRAHSFVAKRLDNRVGGPDPQAADLVASTVARFPVIREAYEGFEFARALREIVEISELANKYFQDRAPFHAIKDDPEEARRICTTALGFVKVLSILLKPILPELAARVERSLGLGELSWADLAFDFQDRELGPFERLAERMELKAVEAMIEAQRQKHAAAEVPGSGQAGASGASAEPSTPAAQAFEPEPIAPEISIDDFAKIDLRVARVMAADQVEGAEKLLKLTIDLGNGPGKERTIFAGIKAHYAPEDLVGRLVVVVANLAPRKMRFGLSEGMVLAASCPTGVFVLGTDSKVLAGSRVK